MKLEKIRLNRINLRDERFRISYFPDLEALAGSIIARGLLSPPLVRSDGERFVLVSGWKRVLACRRAGVSKITAFVTDDRDDLKLCLDAVEENRIHRPLSLAEKAEILDRLEAFGLSQNVLIRDIMPPLALPATRSHLRNLRKLVRAGRDVRRYVHEKSVAFPVLESLLKFGEADRTRLLPVLYPLGQNKQRELLDDLWGVCRRDRLPVRSVLSRGGIGGTLRSPSLTPLDRAERARRLLRKLRYPALSARQEAFEAALRKMPAPRGIAIQSSPHFEDESVSVSFRFRNSAELRDRLRSLEKLTAHPELRRLFRE